MTSRAILIMSLIFLFSCRGKKEAVYSWQGDGESRTLTLLRNGTFILDIQAGYYNRTDTGNYKINGDTLIVNPGKISNVIDSIATNDSLFNGQRHMKVLEEELVFNTENEVQESFYREIVFPSVVINDSVQLSVSEDDPAYHTLIIPENTKIRSIKVTVNEENTCKPTVIYRLIIPEEKSIAGSYSIYLRSKDSKDNYLAGFKWLIHNDTVESFFKNNDCEPSEIKMIRR